MDLSRFDSRAAAEAGVDVDLVLNGEVVIGDDDKPVTFCVKGMFDPDVHALILSGNRITQKSPKEVLEADMKLARAAVVGWSDNFQVEGEKLPYSKANIAKVLAAPAVRRAVLAEVFTEANFTPNA